MILQNIPLFLMRIEASDWLLRDLLKPSDWLIFMLDLCKVMATLSLLLFTPRIKAEAQLLLKKIHWHRWLLNAAIIYKMLCKIFLDFFSNDCYNLSQLQKKKFFLGTVKMQPLPEQNIKPMELSFTITTKYSSPAG